jgi:hypothetical protein
MSHIALDYAPSPQATIPRPLIALAALWGLSQLLFAAVIGWRFGYGLPPWSPPVGPTVALDRWREMLSDYMLSIPVSGFFCMAAFLALLRPQRFHGLLAGSAWAMALLTIAAQLFLYAFSIAHAGWGIPTSYSITPMHLGLFGLAGDGVFEAASRGFLPVMIIALGMRFRLLERPRILRIILGITTALLGLWAAVHFVDDMPHWKPNVLRAWELRSTTAVSIHSLFQAAWRPSQAGAWLLMALAGATFLAWSGGRRVLIAAAWLVIGVEVIIWGEFAFFTLTDFLGMTHVIAFPPGDKRFLGMWWVDSFRMILQGSALPATVIVLAWAPRVASRNREISTIPKSQLGLCR